MFKRYQIIINYINNTAYVRSNPLGHVKQLQVKDRNHRSWNYHVPTWHRCFMYLCQQV